MTALADDSPCVHLCLMDYTAGYCSGCFRTLDEITFWATATAERRREVLAAAEARRASIRLTAD